MFMRTLDKLLNAKDSLKSFFMNEETSQSIPYYTEQVKAALIDLPVAIHTTDISMWKAYHSAYENLELWQDIEEQRVTDGDFKPMAEKVLDQLIESGAYNPSENNEMRQYIIGTLAKRLSQCIEDNNGTSILGKVRQFDNLKPSALSLVMNDDPPENS